MSEVRVIVSQVWEEYFLLTKQIPLDIPKDFIRIMKGSLGYVLPEWIYDFTPTPEFIGLYPAIAVLNAFFRIYWAWQHIRDSPPFFKSLLADTVGTEVVNTKNTGVEFIDDSPALNIGKFCAHGTL